MVLNFFQKCKKFSLDRKTYTILCWKRNFQKKDPLDVANFLMKIFIFFAEVNKICFSKFPEKFPSKNEPLRLALPCLGCGVNPRLPVQCLDHGHAGIRWISRWILLVKVEKKLRQPSLSEKSMVFTKNTNFKFSKPWDLEFYEFSPLSHIKFFWFME